MNDTRPSHTAAMMCARDFGFLLLLSRLRQVEAILPAPDGKRCHHEVFHVALAYNSFTA